MSTMRRAIWLPLPLVTLALVACGSSDKLSKTDLVAKADKICQKRNEKVKALTPPTNGPQFALVEKNANVQAKAEEEAAAKLKQLIPPDSIKSDYDAFIKVGFEVHAATVRKTAAAARAKDKRKVDALLLESFRLTSTVVIDLADKIGFKVCYGR